MIPHGLRPRQRVGPIGLWAYRDAVADIPVLSMVGMSYQMDRARN